MSEVMKMAVYSFVGVFVVIVAAGVILGFVMGEDPDTESVSDYIEVDNPQYDADRVTSDSTPGDATVEMSTEAVDSNVVVHAGGGLSERDIAPLVNTLVESGHQVTVVADETQQMIEGPIVFSEQGVSQVSPPPSGGEESQLSGKLDDAHGFISLGVAGYSDGDLNEIKEFVEDDGRVVMAVDPDQEFSFGEGHSQTYSKLGMFTEPGYVYNLAENDLNYQRIFAESAGDSELTDGVDRAVFDTATPVQAVNQDEAMVPIEGSELSVTRDDTDKPVLVRDGNITLIGDTEFMAPENTQRADNDVLVGNIAEFLVEADRGVDDSSKTNSDDEQADTVTVEVGPDGDPVFSPDVLEIDPGTTVEFEWQSDGYNIVPVYQEPPDADWDGVLEHQDEGYVHEHTFEEEGVHEFMSEPHQEDMMFGVIVVGDP